MCSPHTHSSTYTAVYSCVNVHTYAHRDGSGQARQIALLLHISHYYKHLTTYTSYMHDYYTQRDWSQAKAPERWWDTLYDDVTHGDWSQAKAPERWCDTLYDDVTHRDWSQAKAPERGFDSAEPGVSTRLYPCLYQYFCLCLCLRRCLCPCAWV
jgi:hypothetical protein